MKTPLLIALTLATATLAACTSAPRSGGYGYNDRGYSAPQRCYECGRVERIETVYNARQNSRTGAILGGIVGAVAAREIPKHGSEGRENTATVAGAVAGAIAGNAIENKRNEETFDIHVRMDDGRLIVINTNRLGPDLREGSYVRVDGNRVTPLR
ncbi:MAG TPA: peptidoglycan-associated outer membrane lipoprotein precursor [Arenimonas sp.]|uniref:peptidoglycan-associated outer membrane lipoprotein precursor n=1 Tax=Arenimonas sp. TaxID=1872635 RepID=UPI002D7E8D71|nr:peptidoglycan-associated outer membrane lipoprotein precursor [Arenimonas sp.]HEU0153776.1 peptidoglycan-associated outer membrane lipoprotein precursor [Arenimonas sp.]